MRVFMVPQVSKLLRKERVAHSALCAVAGDVLDGTLGAGEADLGDGLFKKRLARPGGGKSGGFRTIVAYRKPKTERVLFAYGFAKNAASALTPQGHRALAAASAAFIAANDEQVASLLRVGDVEEIDCNG
jgi:hypothetical protein